MKTYVAKPETVERKWFVVDAEGQTLGRLATQIAMVLMGKTKPVYTPHVDCGDYVIVVNAEKIVLTGNKWDQKEYRYNTGYPGGLRKVRYEDLRNKKPELMIERAVRRMMPKTKLGDAMFKKLKVYAGPTHSHDAQKPEALELK